MKHKIFLVHGMGVPEAGWHNGAIKSMRDAYDLYGTSRLASKTFDERFEFVRISYDGIFQELLKTWAADATALDAADPAFAGKGFDAALTEVANSPDTQGNFVWSHAMDVIFFRGFQTVRERIATNIAAKMANEITAQVDEFGESRWSVVAHSLGTAVSTMALDKLFVGFPGDEHTSAFAPVNEQAVAVAMIANVSRVLQTHPPVYDSMIRPGGNGQAGRGCLTYLSPVHPLDPFTILKRFDPANWPDLATTDRYVHPTVEHVHQVNVHALEHYMKHPAVHIELFRALTFPQAISQQVEKDAIAHFKQFDELDEAVGIALREKLESVAPALSGVWTDIPAVWDAFHNLMT